jgi:hypothetical protein
MGTMAKRRRRKGHLEAMDAIVARIYPAPDQIPAVRVFRWWYRAVPERVAERARPVRLSKGVLLVHVASNGWSHELSYLKDDLLRACRRAAPQAGVRDMWFKVGPLPPRPSRSDPRAPKEAAPLAQDEVAQLPEDVGRALAQITDDRVRAAVAQAAHVSLAHKRRP